MAPPPGCAAGDRAAAFLGSPGRPVTCAITALAETSPAQLAALSRLGVDFVQLRDRNASDRDFERFLDHLARDTPEVLPRVLVNDRLGLAATFPVAGVHLPESGLPVGSVRRRFGGRLRVGRSVHSANAAARAAEAGADYLILGAAAPTGDKRPQSPGVFAEAVRRSPTPVWAVGGLNPSTLRVLTGSGISGVAAIRSFSELRGARAFLESIRAAGRSGRFLRSS